MLLTDKEQKKRFKIIAQQDPDRYYPVLTLKELGFVRKQCSKCKTYFWTVNQDQDVCGDSSCSGGFRFIGKSPAKNKLDYIGVWKEFSKLFKRMGYTPIPRYPVVSRWNPTMDYTIASIAAFQPYVVSGEVRPPANPLVIPQFCLRFTDIDNVGITGSHYTGFVMIGQHAFVTPQEYNINKYLKEIYTWLEKGLGLPKEEITFHEDAWAGGGNFGPSMEFFSRGLELGNQVYMQYEQLPNGSKDLNIKVLDMGMGHERNAWFTTGNSTSYESTFPTVVKKLYKQTGIEVDREIINKFLPYSAYLNIDETDDINKVWKMVGKNVGMDVAQLKANIMQLAALYSIADHSRSLLFALSDGALPSNVGGAYNLRIILRRALSFIDKYGWNHVDIFDTCQEHARYLKPLFPELGENLGEVSEILEIEKEKYENTKQKSRLVVESIIKKDIDEGKLIELYDSQGITPEIIKEEASKLGKIVIIPDDFYVKVSARHERQEQVHATHRELGIDLTDVPETEALYFDDYEKVKFTARAIKVSGKHVVLSRTAFYPTSGGQLHDIGAIQGNKVVDVVKQGNVIVHIMENDMDSSVQGMEVDCEIDFGWRKQLSQHHTATHIINAAARRVLGRHINQAGAKKTKEKAQIDLTHFKAISDDELKRIEVEANRIIKESLPIRSRFMARDQAEKEYGMGIYQGGAVPGQKLRIVEIPEVDVECCGGTHLKHTGEAGEIKILKTTKISDGIVRVTFVAGDAAKHEEKSEHEVLEETAKILGVKNSEVPARAEELFSKWKLAKKAVQKGKAIPENDLKLVLRVQEKLGDEELLKRAADIFKTQPEHVPRTALRFMQELQDMRRKLKK